MDQVSLDVAPIDVVESFEYHIKVRIWPHCEVIALLKPYRERNLNQNMGLQVTPTTGHSDRFIEGARILVQLVQAGYDGYLYVAYYTVEGPVVHLSRSEERRVGTAVVSTFRFRWSPVP